MALSILDQIAAELAAASQAAPAYVPTQDDKNRAVRAAANSRHRRAKQAHKVEVLAECDGDRESIKTITVWMPRSKKGQLFAKGYEKRFIGGKKADEAHDDKTKRAVASANAVEAVYEVDETVYDLTEIEVPRARPPKEEVMNAQFEGRYTEHHGGASFFAPAQAVRYKARPTDYYAPLGDFQWADREEAVTAANQATHERAKARNRPIRNVREAC